MSMLLRRYHREKSEAMSDNTDTASTFLTENVNQYTKTEINRMSKDELVTLALANRIENAEDLNGSELKQLLIEKFGL